MAAERDPFVRTVLGDVSPGSLGHVQPHEHLLCDLSPVLGSQEIREPIALDNYDRVRRTVFTRENLQLVSESDAIAEMRIYRTAGGGAVVDSTSIGLGRDPLGLARISRESGVQVVMGSGYYVHDYHPPNFSDRPQGEIRDEILRDVQDGVADTGVRSGMIGEIGLSWPVHPDERKVLLAAVEAQRASGAPLQIHPGRDSASPLAAMVEIIEADGNPGRTIMSHIDRTLWDLDDILELARTGCYLELDLFGQESSYYAPNPDARRPNDDTRIEWMMALFDQGFGERLLIAQDICQKVYLRRYGGPGYTHILEAAVPLMRRRGMSEEQIRTVTVTNPATVLTFA